MITATSFYDFMLPMVESACPAETLAFEMEGERMIDDLMTGRSLQRSSSDPSLQYEFAGGLSTPELLQFVGLLTATWAAYVNVDTYLRSRKADKLVRADFQRQWREELLKGGITPEAADRLTEKFGEKFAELIQHHASN